MLPAGARLRHSSEFTSALRASRVARADGLLVLHASTGGGASCGVARIGFVVPRAVGDAVTRNRLRRRLRHLLRDRLEQLPAGSLLVIRVLPAAAGATSARLAAALDRALSRVFPQVMSRPVLR